MQTGGNAFSRLDPRIMTTVWKKNPPFHEGTPFDSNVNNRGLAEKENTASPRRG
jgi:hypothetical protein